MNESILQALMRLFALVAYVNEKGQPSIERIVVQEYLQRQFSSHLVEHYLYAFDKYLSEHHPDLRNASDDERKELNVVNSKAVKDLCNQLNEELEQEQKTFILISLLDFISSGEQHSDYQFRFTETVAKNLNIHHREYTDAKSFAFDKFDEIKDQKNLLFIDSEPPTNNDKIKHLLVKKMEGKIAVLQIESTNTLVFRYQGNEVLLLNGHNLKANRSYIWAQGSVIKNPRFGAIYYIWVAGKFLKASQKSPFVFTAEEIEYRYGNSPNGVKKFNLIEESGRLIGIIGGSGSGKSTLLKVLSGLIKPNHGAVKINGFDIHKDADKLKGMIGYVPQDDFLIKELSVYQNLYYSAKFSFSQKSEEKINTIVEKALIDFDLVEARDLQVGDSLNTYLSGGQRKRLNIALELLREPAVLFVDEPTSGLSSMDSEKVMNLLKRQTFKGKLVFSNIHQPSSDIFKLFDKLLIVDQGGRVIWYGNPMDAITYLKHMNHYVDADTSECLTCGNINSEQILRNVEARMVDVNGKLTRNRKTSPEEWYSIYMDRVDPVVRNTKYTPSCEIPKSNFSPPTRWEQIKLYFKRDLLSKLKNGQYLLVTLAEAPVLALLLAFYTRSSRDAAGNITDYTFGLNNNIPAFLFIAVIVAIFLGLILSAEEIFRDRKLLQRERYLSLSRSSYLFSKTFVLFLISLIQISTFILVSSYILEIKGMYWRYLVVLFTAAAWANVVGLNISSGFKSVVTIYILVPIILVPQLLFSGVVVDFNNLNNSVQSFKYVPLVGDAMTSRWSYEALVTTQYKDNKINKLFFEPEQIMSNALYNKAYLIPELHDRLENINKNIDNRKKYSEVTADLALLNNELHKLYNRSAKDQPNIINQLNIEEFNIETYIQVDSILNRFKRSYHSQYLQALNKYDEIYYKAIKKFGGREEFINLKNTYANNQLGKIVKNDKEITQYFVHNGNIIKLKDPIFTLPFAKNGRAHFYAPMKRIGNFYIDSFWFDIIVIWLSTIVLFVVLYFDVLFKVIKYFENLRLRRFNKRIVNVLDKLN